VRLKYVIDKNGIHPLKAYKSGRTNNHQYHSVDIIQQNSQKFKTHHTSQGDSVMPSILGMPKKYSETPAKKEAFSLLDDDNPPQENWEMKQHKKPQEVHHVHHHHVTHVQNGKITAE
jgi:hypothetical protein